MNNENNNISIDAAAEQWVRLLLTHLESNKQQKVTEAAEQIKETHD